jgi:uncharacterized protein YndB with AHSA1/START domain
MAIVDGRVEHEILVAATPEAVFRYFTDPDLVRRWMGRHAKLDPQTGGQFHVEINDQATAAGEYVVVQPPHRVVLSWGWVDSPDVPPGASTVEVTLTAQGEATLVRLVHTGLPAGQHEQHDHGWGLLVPRLRTVVAGEDPGPDPIAG